MLINEFKELISNEELDSYIKRIRALTPNKIDELWFLCNFILSGHEKNNLKALRTCDIEKITSDDQSAKQLILYLFRETRKEVIEKNLKEIEKQIEQEKQQ